MGSAGNLAAEQEAFSAMHAPPLRTDVLMFGQTNERWDHHSSVIKDGLQGQNMGWSFISNPKPNLQEALVYIAEREQLELVVIWNDDERQRWEMVVDCTVLAMRLSRHPNNPWVTIPSRELDYLAGIFERKGVHVEAGHITDVIVRRWQHQATR